MPDPTTPPPIAPACPHCGANVARPDLPACGHCGRPLGSSSTAPPVTASSAPPVQSPQTTADPQQSVGSPAIEMRNVVKQSQPKSPRPSTSSVLTPQERAQLRSRVRWVVGGLSVLILVITYLVLLGLG